MTIISIEPNENSCHTIQSQPDRSACWEEGYIEVPAHLEAAVWDSGGYCDLTIENGTLTGITPVSPPSPDLEPIKERRIQQSKTELATYLAAHPIRWTDWEYYSITAEKQAQLTSKLMAATMAQQAGTRYTLTWNSTGEVCKEWTLSDLSALAFAIDERVTALVSYQQKQEVAMREAQTLDELNAVVVNYDSVV